MDSYIRYDRDDNYERNWLSGNQKMQYDIVRHGNEQEPVIIIDDFSSHFEQLKEASLSANFAPALAGYPGIRSPLNPSYLGERGELLSEITRNIYGFTKGINCESCDYSIVTAKPHDLVSGQCIPHYDSADNDVLAMMHYMLGAQSGGTAFYRHKATGFEAITPERQSHYKAILKSERESLGEAHKSYIYGDNKQFEMIGEVEAKPNRLILYRGRILHSGCIAKDANLSPDPAIGRITINGFLVDK